jgi:phosphate-selective porin OprO and OprP
MAAIARRLVPFLTACFFASTATAEEAQPIDDRTDAVGKRLDDDGRRLQDLSRRLEGAEQALAGRAKSQGIVTAEEAGFGIGSPDKQFQVRLHGQLQIDGRRFFDDDSLRDLDTFLVRRARPTVEVTLLGLADAVFTPDFAGGTLQLFDAYIDVHPRPWLRLRAGKFKPPIGLERL